MILIALKVLSIFLKNSSRLSSPLSLNCRLRELDIEVKLEKYALTVSRSLELWYFMANLKSVIQGLLHKNIKLCSSILDESTFFSSAFTGKNNLCTTVSNLYSGFVGVLGLGFFFSTSDVTEVNVRKQTKSFGFWAVVLRLSQELLS